MAVPNAKMKYDVRKLWAAPERSDDAEIMVLYSEAKQDWELVMGIFEVREI